MITEYENNFIIYPEDISWKGKRDRKEKMPESASERQTQGEKEER